MTARTFHRFAASLAILFVLTCTAAFAQNTIHVPADQPTIQAGINAASNGDTVLVAPGTYHENIDFKGKAITVTSSDGPAKTTIDGGGIGPAVTFQTQEPRTSILSNFTVTHGGLGPASGQQYGYSGSGVRIANSAPTILNNVITQNYCTNIQVGNSYPLIQGNTVSSSLNPEKCSVVDTGGINLGGAYYLQFGSFSPQIIGNIIENNTTGQVGDGGGDGGAGIWVDAAGTPLILGNIIRNNITRTGSGGGILTVNADVTIVQNLIYGNSAGCGGGAIAFQSGSIGTPPYTVLIANNTIADNTGGTGGGYSNCNRISQIFASPYSYGSSGPSAALVNNIISGSSSSYAIDCGEISSDPNAEAYQPVFDHNILYNVGATFFGPHCVDTSAKYGNIAADPQFVNSTVGDYHLKVTSPAIDAGNNSVLQSIANLAGAPLTKDLDGNPRSQDVTGKGYPVIDMGAYEYAGMIDASDTTIVLTSSAYTGNAGSNYTLTATLASALGTPTGSAVFFLDGKQIGVSAIDGTGKATLSNVLLTPGVHNLYATYAGQGSFTPATSVVIIVLINLYNTNLTLTSSLNPSIVGQSVTFTVTTSSADAGYVPSPVTLTDGYPGTTLATLLPDSSGIATYTTNSLSLGYHTINATFTADTLHASAGASVVQQVISGYPTSIALTGSPNPSISGQNVTFTATITSTNGTPTGSVQFTDNGTSIGLQTLDASGIATLSTSTLSVGTHNITATYLPTGSFAGSSANISQTVNAITNTVNLTSSLNPSTYGQPVTFTAHISSNSTAGPVNGSVAFYDTGTFLATQPVDASGNAATTTSTLTVGGHSITGVYTPAGSTTTSVGALAQQVTGLATSTLLTGTPTTGVAHITPITLTATVAPAAPGGSTPTGQVFFYVNGAQFNLATLVNGVATYTGTLPAGVDQIYAVYVGDPTRVYDSSNSNTVSVTITAAPSTLSLTSSLNPAPALTPFNLSAQLTLANGDAVGAGYPVTFTIAPTTTAQSSTNASGTATTASAGLLPGQYLVTATFAGTTDLQPSTATSFIETITANPTATTLTASPNPGIQNNPVTFTSTVSALAGSASPSGTVTIYDSLSPSTAFTSIATLTIPSTAGTTATFTTSALVPGTHILYAAFTPAAGFAPSQSAQFTLFIEPQSFTLTLSDPTLTIQTGHHRSETATLTSIGGLTRTFTLSCGTLPQYASCGWGQSSVMLPANGTVSSTLTIDTDQLLGFLASNARPATNPSSPFTRQEWVATTAFTLFPLALLGFRRRRNLRSLLPLLLLAALASTLTACGANQYPYSTTPGTYIVHITATGPPVPGGASPTQTVDLTLDVTR